MKWDTSPYKLAGNSETTLPSNQTHFGAARGETLLVTLAGAGRNGDPLLYLLQRGRRRGWGEGGRGRGGRRGARLGPSQCSRGGARQGAGGAVVCRRLVPCTGVGAVTSRVLLGCLNSSNFYLVNEKKTSREDIYSYIYLSLIFLPFI